MAKVELQGDSMRICGMPAKLKLGTDNATVSCNGQPSNTDACHTCSSNLVVVVEGALPVAEAAAVPVDSACICQEAAIWFFDVETANTL